MLTKITSKAIRFPAERSRTTASRRLGAGLPLPETCTERFDKAYIQGKGDL
jgi:hypothetical protein